MKRTERNKSTLAVIVIVLLLSFLFSLSGCQIEFNEDMDCIEYNRKIDKEIELLIGTPVDDQCVKPSPTVLKEINKLENLKCEL